MNRPAALDPGEVGGREVLLALVAAALAGPWPELPGWTVLLRLPLAGLAVVLLVRRRAVVGWIALALVASAGSLDGLIPAARPATSVAGDVNRRLVAVQEHLAEMAEWEDLRRILASGGAEAEPERPFALLRQAERGFPVRLDALALLNSWGRPVAWDGPRARLPLQLRPLGQRAVVAEAGVDAVWVWWREPIFDGGRPMGSVLAGAALPEGGSRRVLGVGVGRAAVARPLLEGGERIENPAGQQLLGLEIAPAPLVGWSGRGWAMGAVGLLLLAVRRQPRPGPWTLAVAALAAVLAVTQWLGGAWWPVVGTVLLAWAAGALRDGWWAGVGSAMVLGGLAWMLPGVVAEVGAVPVPADLLWPAASTWALAVALTVLLFRLPRTPWRVPVTVAVVVWLPLVVAMVRADSLLLGVGAALVTLAGRGRRSIIPAGVAAAVLLTGTAGAVARSELVATTETTLARISGIGGPARALLASLPGPGLEELVRLPEPARLVVLGRLARWLQFERTVPGASLALLGPGDEEPVVWGETMAPGGLPPQEVASRWLAGGWRVTVLLPPPPFDLLEALAAGGAGGPLAMFDRAGSPTVRGSTFRPMSPGMVGRALARERDWQTVEVGERRLRAYMRAWGEGVLAVPWMRPPLPEQGLAVAGLTLLGCVPLASWRERRRWRRWWQERRSFSGRVRVLAVVATMLPVVVLAQFLPRQWIVQQGRSRQDLARAVTRPLVVEPDFGNLAWLVRDRGAVVALYRGGVLEWTSRPDHAVLGLTPVLPPGEAYARAVRGWQEPVVVAGDTLSVFAALADEPEPTVVGVLVLTAAGAASGPSPREWFVITGLFGLWLAVATAERLGRRLTLPLQRLVGEVQRLERGEPVSGLGTGGDQEVVVLGNAFAAMAHTVRRREEDLRRERDVLERVLGTLSAAVVVCDQGGRIALANRAARAVLGGDHQDALPTGRFGDRVEAVIRRGLAGETLDETVHPSHQADTLWRISAVPLARAEGQVLMVLEDLSDVARAERLASLTELARIVAHEVKNPLTPIRLWAEEIKAALDGGGDLAGVARLAAEEILNRVEHLRDVVQGFSNLAALEHWEAESVDLAAAARRVVSEYGILTQRGVEVVVVGEGVAVSLDRRWFQRAIRHLLENSVRALAGRPGRVNIAVATDAAGARVTVRDTAGGVSPEHIGRLFEPHFSTTAGGTGLGLAVVRRVAERAGGRAEAANGPAGLEVTLHFPAAGSEP